MTATQNTLHRNLMLLPAGGGPTGRWAYVFPSGCAWPSPAGKPQARMPQPQAWLQGGAPWYYNKVEAIGNNSNSVHEVVARVKSQIGVSACRGVSVAPDLQTLCGLQISSRSVCRELHGTGFDGRAAASEPYITKFNAKRRMQWCKAWPLSSNLIQATQESNVNIPQMADTLFERAGNASWIVVFKALATTHHLMVHGNERFIQFLASRNTLFNLSNFLDKTGSHGYDMSTFIRRYSRYLNEKAFSYRQMAFDFGRVKKGNDGVMRTMTTDKLLKGMSTLQNQIDALLEFDQDNAPCHKAEMVQEWFDDHNNQFEELTPPPNSPGLNPVQRLWDVLDKQVPSMEAPPHNLQDLKDLLLTSWCQIPQHTFRDLVESMPRWVRAVWAAKEGRPNIRQVVIMLCLIEKFFQMKKGQCKDALEIYKKFLTRMTRVSEFLKIAEQVGIDKSDIPELTQAPESLLESLETHLNTLEGKRG
ncbi:hypothetical protein QTP70_012374 [Hemibagrus guttatus]|uniref:ENTH domain-containing protein n=1 Tax=Hemibagrus guttatus TaxID=175788 RepID=A0AAE0Q4B9_9TELE|nr:hypothetical protein QTP70_012374 [Hemibagrus guttatus]